MRIPYQQQVSKLETEEIRISINLEIPKSEGTYRKRKARDEDEDEDQGRWKRVEGESDLRSCFFLY